MWKTILAMAFAAPIIALMGGVGILAWQVGQTWTEAQTASLIMGLVTVCGGGALVAAFLLALVVGIPFAIRTTGDLGSARRAWDPGPPPRVLPGPGPQRWIEDRPPTMIKDKNVGSWQASQAAQYDLWEDDTVESDW